MQCLVCGGLSGASCFSCPSCGASPAIIDGFEAYAPEYAHGGGGFEPSLFATFARLEERNFWFRARNRLILWALGKYAPDFGSFLEVGCGTGFVLSAIRARFPGRTLTGGEIFLDGLSIAAKRLPGVRLMQMDARQIPFADEFDALGAFDVIEHIDEAELALAQIRKALKPGGIAIITVPQHAWLWSPADEYAGHKRRYSAAEIERAVKSAGFRLLRSTSFVTSLLPALMLSCLLKKYLRRKFAPLYELYISQPLNTLLETILNIEISSISSGLSYPVGGSRLVVAAKE
jgi:SAM-dependent methyltransferase